MMISVSVVAGKMVVVVGQQLVAQLGVVRQLPVEAEAEPFVLLQMVPLERLGVVEVILAARGVANVADRRPAGVALHDALRLAAMAQPKDFADASQRRDTSRAVAAGRGCRSSCRPRAGRGSEHPAASAESTAKLPPDLAPGRAGSGRCPANGRRRQGRTRGASRTWRRAGGPGEVGGSRPNAQTIRSSSAPATNQARGIRSVRILRRGGLPLNARKIAADCRFPLLHRPYFDHFAAFELYQLERESQPPAGRASSLGPCEIESARSAAAAIGPVAIPLPLWQIFMPWIGIYSGAPIVNWVKGSYCRNCNL